jgi:hypothetical protein
VTPSFTVRYGYPQVLAFRPRVHPVVPGNDGREHWQSLLAFRRQRKGKQRWKQEVVRHRDVFADDEGPAVGQLLCHDLQRPDHLGHSALHDPIIARDAKLRIDQTLVRHVVDELRIEVPVEIADPLIHPRPLARIIGRQSR